MQAQIINGLEIRKAILDEIKAETARLKSEKGIVPGLVTILVGENPASVSYVTLKVKTAIEMGFNEVQVNMSADCTKQELLDTVEKYNKDPSIHGILVQLPLPKHIDENKIIYAIDPDKDVDGFHPVNIGRLVLGGEHVKFPPCTPAGIVEMIARPGVETNGKEVVIVGRSNLVGKPLANMLCIKGKNANATVTVCHTGTKDLESHCRRADILVAAVGRPQMITADMIKPGAIVIDVGINKEGITKIRSLLETKVANPFSILLRVHIT